MRLTITLHRHVLRSPPRAPGPPASQRFTAHLNGKNWRYPGLDPRPIISDPLPAGPRAMRQCPPVLVLRCCPRPPRRHLAARNTKCTGARPQPRTTPPPRPAPAPCPARPALLLSFAPSSPRASARALPCDAPVPCQCPALRRCGHARPAVTCNSAKQSARQSPRPTPRHRHATTRHPTPAPRPAMPPSRAKAPPCAAAAMPAPLSPATAQGSAHAKAWVYHHATASPPHAAPRQRPAVPCQCKPCAAAASHAPSSPATGQTPHPAPLRPRPSHHQPATGQSA